MLPAPATPAPASVTVSPAASSPAVWSVTVITNRSVGQLTWTDHVTWMDSNSNNNNSDGLLSSSSGGAPIIPDGVMRTINVYVNILMCGGVAAFGVLNNVVNAVIFYRLGLRDSMSVGLMALSVSDFLHSLLVVASRGLSLWDVLLQPLAVDPLAVNYVAFDWVRDILYLSSGWITTFLSLERCVCVVSPFRVRRIFTRGRCLAAVALIYAGHACLYMPVFVTQRLGWTRVAWPSSENETVLTVDRLVAVFSDYRPRVDAYVDVADGLPVISQLVVMVSVVWMIHGLRVSSKLRSAMTAAAAGERTEGGGGEGKRQTGGGLSGKNKRLVKVVLFLAIILTVCNVPRFVAAYARHAHPEVTFDRREQNLFVLLWTLAILSTVVNTSVNVFVYLIINSNYRAMFKQMFCRCG